MKISDNRSSAITTYAYDGFGNIIAEAYKKSDNSMSIKTETVYDSTGSFVTSTKDENGYSTTSQYDMERGLLTSYTNAKGTVTEYGYDSLDRLTSVTEGDMGHVISYNSKNLLSSIDTGNTDYSFEYDQFGNMTGVSIGNQRISSNTYAANNGDLTSYSLNNGMSYSYEYDSRGELIKVKRGNSLVQHIVYDREGTLLESRNYSSGLVTRYRYDFDGNVVGTDVYALQADGIADRWKYGVETGYDEHERVIRNSVKTHGTSYNSDITYDSSGKVATSTSGGKTITYSYDDINRPIKRSLGIETGVDITYAYKDSARGAGYTTSQLAAERIGGVRYAYEYDRNGNITSINRTDSSNNGKVIYTYDSHDQLIREDNPISGTSTSYAYDAYGNVTSKTVKNYANGTIGSQISSVSYNYGSAVSGDRLTKIGNEAITYDSIGNPLNMDGWTLSWSGRRLTSMTKGNDAISFGYDAEGRRISKTVNGAKTRYFYIGDTVVGEESAANGKIAYIYDDAGRISALRRTINGTTTTYHLLTNSRGDVEAIYLSDGTLIARYIYDAYGNEIMKEYGSTEAHRGMANINPFRYRGYMYDKETGYYYLMSRYYNPTIGRFVNADVMLDTDFVLGYNLYVYCTNNPIIYVDFSGYGRTYVFYYNKPGSGFYEQAMNSPYYNKNSRNVYMIGVKTSKDFVKAWNSMKGPIDYIYLYLHGGKGVLYFNASNLTFSGKTSFNDLKSIRVNKGVYLLSCKGGAGKEGNNVAYMFAKLTKSKVYACTGSVSYSNIFGKYYARKSCDLGIMKTFYYSRRYICIYQLSQ